jgi:hypothetical protein
LIVAKPKWHIQTTGDVLTLARHLPARFDVAAETALPSGSRLWLAHQIRQDMWRALRNLRGFSPVVEVARGTDELRIKAGGSIAGRFAKAQIEEQISRVLSHPETRARWIRFAERKAVRHA